MDFDNEQEIRDKLDAIEQWIDSNAEIIDRAGHSVTLIRAVPETDDERIHEFIEASGIDESEAKFIDLGKYKTLTVGSELRQRCMCLTALVDLYENGSIDNPYEFVVFMSNMFLHRLFCEDGPIAEFDIPDDDEDFDTLEDLDIEDLDFDSEPTDED